MFKQLLFFILILSTARLLPAQSVLGQGNSPQGPYLFSFDITTCSSCPVMPVIPLLYNCDFVVLPNGNIFAAQVSQGQVLAYIYDPPATTPVQTFAISTNATPNLVAWYDAIIAPDGTMYMSGTDGLYTFNYNTGALAYIGPWPAPYPFIMPELILIEGEFYGVGATINGQPNSAFYHLNLTNPAQSVLLHPIMPTIFQDGIFGISNTANPEIYAATFDNGDVAVATYDTLANTTNFYCDIPDNLGAFYNEIPSGAAYTCLCLTSAGTLPAVGPYGICINSTLTFPAATGVILDGNDLLQYVLFSNPGDTVGSIVATSTTPDFTFAPPMQTGVTYYIAAMAGNELNGSIDLNDPCLDFSNARQVIWRPLPAVTFSVANPNVCAGACTTVTAAFSGTAPFTLSYMNPSTGSVTQTFSGNSGTFQVCTPPGAPAGSLLVQAMTLTDAFCTCQ